MVNFIVPYLSQDSSIFDLQVLQTQTIPNAHALPKEEVVTDHLPETNTRLNFDVEKR